MNDEEFDQFLQDSVDELERQQESLKETYGLGTWAAFAYDLPTGLLTFKDAAGTVQVECDTIPIATYATRSSSWQWAWANKSMPPGVQQKAHPLQELAELTGLEIFSNSTAEVDESMAWELAAMACRHLKAQGCYHMPAGAQGQIIVFVALTDVRSLKS